MPDDIGKPPRAGFSRFLWTLGLTWKFYFAILLPLVLLPLVFMKDEGDVWVGCEEEPRKSTVNHEIAKTKILSNFAPIKYNFNIALLLN